MVKRAFDIVFSLTLLLLLSPFLLVVALAVKLSDGGPILYRHERVGRYGTHFFILKFRTMVQRHAFKSELTLRRDPRITPIGRFLRATKLDELPQLINVLRGEMSVVGPRPESPRYVAHYTPEMRAALDLRPGLTGPASVLFRSQEQLLDGMDFEQYYVAVLMPVKMGINLEYVAHHSVWIDLTIIARTIIALFRPSPPPPLVSPAEAVRAALPALEEQGLATTVFVAASVPSVPVKTPRATRPPQPYIAPSPPEQMSASF
ncbi:MAG: sugar transferase [Ktedonobacterales bacterium]